MIGRREQFATSERAIATARALGAALADDANPVRILSCAGCGRCFLAVRDPIEEDDDLPVSFCADCLERARPAELDGFYDDLGGGD
jgi:hypothetical protein